MVWTTINTSNTFAKVGCPDVMRTTSDGWQPSLRYPDPAIEILDERFKTYRLQAATVERLANGCRWNEGPVWFGDGRYLLWSDIHRMMLS
jgi:hypothetical protein